MQIKRLRHVQPCKCHMAIVMFDGLANGGLILVRKFTSTEMRNVKSVEFGFFSEIHVKLASKLDQKQPTMCS